MKPKKGEFRIRTHGGTAVRSGWILGDWATTKERYFWAFTHCPSGYRVNVYPCHDNKESALAHLELLHAGTAPQCQHIKDLYARESAEALNLK